MGNLITACGNYRKSSARKTHLFDHKIENSFDNSKLVRQPEGIKRAEISEKRQEIIRVPRAFKAELKPRGSKTGFERNRGRQVLKTFST